MHVIQQTQFLFQWKENEWKQKKKQKELNAPHSQLYIAHSSVSTPLHIVQFVINIDEWRRWHRLGTAIRRDTHYKWNLNCSEFATSTCRKPKWMQYIVFEIIKSDIQTHFPQSFSCLLMTYPNHIWLLCILLCRQNRFVMRLALNENLISCWSHKN